MRYGGRAEQRTETGGTHIRYPHVRQARVLAERAQSADCVHQKEERVKYRNTLQTSYVQDLPKEREGWFCLD